MKGDWFGRLISRLGALIAWLVGLYFFLLGLWFAAVGVGGLFDHTQPHRSSDNSGHFFAVFLGLLVMGGAVFATVQFYAQQQQNKYGTEDGPWLSKKGRRVASVFVGLLILACFIWNASLHSGPPRVKGGLNLGNDAENSDCPAIHIRGQTMLVINRSETDWSPVYIGLNPGERGFSTGGDPVTLSPDYEGYVARIAVLKAGQTVSLPLSRFKTTDGRILDPKTTVLTSVQTQYNAGYKGSGSSGDLTPE